MDCFVRIGTRLAEGLNEGRHVFAFGIGEDHLFAEELTAGCRDMRKSSVCFRRN
ncbi:MAG: hypothetical protein ACLSA6_14220 [Holdemania massiliensis]